MHIPRREAKHYFPVLNCLGKVRNFEQTVILVIALGLNALTVANQKICNTEKTEFEFRKEIR